MKKIAAIVAASVLALSGCSSESDAPEETTAAADATTSEAGSEFAAVGDTIPAGCQFGDCLGEFQVDEITVGGECKIVDDFLGAPPIPNGMQLIQISGVQTATSDAKKPGTDEPVTMILGWPEVWDKDDFKNSADSLVGCVTPDGYETWGTSSSKGERVRIYGTFLIPEGSKVLGVEKSRFDLTKLAAPETTAATSPSASTSAAAASAAAKPAEDMPATPVAPVAPVSPVEAPQNVAEAPDDLGEIPPGPDNPGPNGEYADLFDPSRISYCDESAENTVFTDGSTGFTAECASALYAGE